MDIAMVISRLFEEIPLITSFIMVINLLYKSIFLKASKPSCLDLLHPSFSISLSFFLPHLAL